MRTLAGEHHYGKVGFDGDGARIILAGGKEGWWYETDAPAKCFAPECPFKEGQWVTRRSFQGVTARVVGFLDDGLVEVDRRGPAFFGPDEIPAEELRSCAPPRSAWPCLYPGDRVRLVPNPCGPDGVPGTGLLDEAYFVGIQVVKGIGNWGHHPVVVLGAHGGYVWPWNLERVEP